MRHIRIAVTEDMAKSVAYALIVSRLDYANSVMYGMSSSNATRLQRAQNAECRCLSSHLGFQAAINKLVRSFETVTLAADRVLHQVKIACITYKTVCTAQPAYLHSVLKQYAPSRRLRFHQTVVCWLSPVSVHVLVLVVLL